MDSSRQTGPRPEQSPTSHFASTAASFYILRVHQSDFRQHGCERILEAHQALERQTKPRGDESSSLSSISTISHPAPPESKDVSLRHIAAKFPVESYRVRYVHDKKYKKHYPVIEFGHNAQIHLFKMREEFGLPIHVLAQGGSQWVQVLGTSAGPSIEPDGALAKWYKKQLKVAKATNLADEDEDEKNEDEVMSEADEDEEDGMRAALISYSRTLLFAAHRGAMVRTILYSGFLVMADVNGYGLALNVCAVYAP
ncbi:hypothetical protein V8E36_005018 [Tilletia maclaganii]